MWLAKLILAKRDASIRKGGCVNLRGGEFYCDKRDFAAKKLDTRTFLQVSLQLAGNLNSTTGK